MPFDCSNPLTPGHFSIVNVALPHPQVLKSEDVELRVIEWTVSYKMYIRIIF